LFSVSSHSRLGMESWTMPAPALTEAMPLATTQVRMVMARSMRRVPETSSGWRVIAKQMASSSGESPVAMRA